MGLTWIPPTYGFLEGGASQSHDSEHATGTSSGNLTSIVIKMCITITGLFCPAKLKFFVCFTLCKTRLGQKFCVTSNI